MKVLIVIEAIILILGLYMFFSKEKDVSYYTRALCYGDVCEDYIVYCEDEKVKRMERTGFSARNVRDISNLDEVVCID